MTTKEEEQKQINKKAKELQAAALGAIEHFKAECRELARTHEKYDLATIKAIKRDLGKKKSVTKRSCTTYNNYITQYGINMEPIEHELDT